MQGPHTHYTTSRRNYSGAEGSNPPFPISQVAPRARAPMMVLVARIVGGPSRRHPRDRPDPAQGVACRLCRGCHDGDRCGVLGEWVLLQLWRFA